MSRTQPRRRLTGAELMLLHLATGAAAALAGIVTAAAGTSTLVALRVLCRPAPGDTPGTETLHCPDGVAYALPAAVLAATGALAVLVTVLLLVARRVDGPTLLRLSRHVSWAGTAAVALPGLGLAILSWDSVPGAGGFLAAAAATVPPVASYAWPRWAVAAPALWAAAPAAIVLAGGVLPLLVPFALPAATLWTLAAVLAHRHRRAPERAGHPGA